MKLRRISFPIVVVTIAATVRAQELPQIPGPEKEHQFLQQFAGQWSTISKAEMGSGQPAVECTGSIRARMIGGLWVVNEIRTEMAGTSVIGLQTIGYDPAKKKYVGTWVDSMVNHLWHYEGTVDETGRILTLEAEGPNLMAAGKLTKFQDIYEFKSADEIAASSRMLDPDGNWITFMSGTATRQRADAAAEE